MKAKRILVSWIGHADLRAMAMSLPAAKQEKIAQIVRGPSNVIAGTGPVKTLLAQEHFDGVHLLSNYAEWVNTDYAQWLDTNPIIHATKIEDVTDYGEIFQAADATLQGLASGHTQQSFELSILLSPGTPAMAAVWVLLGKSKYPAHFWQTFEGKARETVIPFDLAVDFIPDVLRDADSAFHHLLSFSPGEVEGFERIIGNSRAIRLVVGRARKAALRDVPVLFLGESGTGKELFARAVHAASQRKHGPFVAINCAAVPKDLLESELFGHTKAAFTGAIKAKDGAFKRANGGVLFLDEIGECDPSIQAKLLRVLEPPPGASFCTREFFPVGAEEAIRSDVRILAATNRNLLDAVREGRFREDLYFRLAAISLVLPPLRERKSDIPALVTSLLDRINREFATQEPGYTHKTFSSPANLFVKQCDWPGNVRQLSNVLLQAAVMAEGDQLSRADIEQALSDWPSTSAANPLAPAIGDGFSLEKHLESIQIRYLQRAMEESGGVKSKAARLLGYKNYQTLDAQLKRLGVKFQLR